MTQVWIYVLGASHDPNRVRCAVPWCVDERSIFFGPCKKRFREKLRKEHLVCGDRRYDYKKVSNGVLIVGVNASNPSHCRKIVWAGKLTEVMTFAEAHERLVGKRFEKLRNHENSPLHVKPILEDGELIGYEHVSNEHAKNQDWISDLATISINRRISEKGRQCILKEHGLRLDGKKLLVVDGTHRERFGRDCCMLLENLFFANYREKDGKGMKGIGFDKESLNILKLAQPDASKVDEYAIFGCVNGKVVGRRGGSLPLTNDLAKQFIAWLEKRCQKSKQAAQR
jgi:hypothetical protein